MLKTDIAALGRCDGMGTMDLQGSYVKLVYSEGGDNKHLVISEGCADNLIGGIIGSLRATKEEREKVARAIWNVMRDHEDRCDMELEDMGSTHPVWAMADAAIVAKP
jgi:hypothetical protein